MYISVIRFSHHWKSSYTYVNLHRWLAKPSSPWQFVHSTLKSNPNHLKVNFERAHLAVAQRGGGEERGRRRGEERKDEERRGCRLSRVGSFKISFLCGAAWRPATHHRPQYDLGNEWVQIAVMAPKRQLLSAPAHPPCSSSSPACGAFRREGERKKKLSPLQR